MRTKLMENERLVKEGKANFFNTILNNFGPSAGGTLYLTNQRLIFEGHGFNVGKEAAIVNLSDVASSGTGLPNTFYVITNQNQEFKFSVFRKKEWQSALDNLI